MDWNQYIDLYCERTAPGLWNEPLNALTNAAFWLAAALVASRCKRRQIPLDAELRSLLGLLVLIGAASFAFHTFANRWSAAADTLAIALYLHAWLALYLRRVRGWHWRWAWLGVPVFFVLAQLFAAGWRLAQIDPAAYLGAWSVLLLVTADSALRQHRAAWPLAAAAVVFAASVTLRQLDLPLCPDWHWGTHFGWHMLNALTLGLTAWALAIAPSRGGHAQAKAPAGA